jgi:MoxR-like ATPase
MEGKGTMGLVSERSFLLIKTDTLPEEVNRLLKANRRVDSGTFESLIRPNDYVPPNMELLIDAIVALSMGKNILLKGPTGSGKTKFAETLSALFHQPMFSVNCSVDLDAESLLGFKTLEYKEDKQVIEFIPGPVTNAMKDGCFLYIDEINMAKPETLPLINGVLDYRRTITNPFTNEIITANEGFGVIAAINEGYIGTVPLNEALKNRFIVIDVPYLEGEQLKDLILNSTALTDEPLADLFVKLSDDLITAVYQGKLPEEAASIRALVDACDLSTVITPKRAILRSIVDKLEEDREREFVINLAETLF